jgi:Spy/CpxP family protein refolding chaperone
MKKLLLLAGVVVLTASSQVYAQEATAQDCPCPPPCGTQNPEFAPRGEHMQRPPHFDMKKFEEELNLTDKQKEQAKALREKQFETAKPLLDKLRANEEDSQAIKQQLRDLRKQGKQDFEALLTDKQLKKLEKLKSEQKDNFKGHHGDHRRPPMPPQCNCGCNNKTAE